MVNKMPVVMVVDDDWMNREVLEAYLQSGGYTVLSAHSGEQALQLVAQNTPDLIMLDMRMQGMNGLEVCRHLKQQDSTRRVPVLIVTALGNDNEKQDAINAGADDFVPKPLDAIIMMNRVKSLLRMKQLADELQAREDLLRRVLERYVNSDTARAIVSELVAQSRE